MWVNIFLLKLIFRWQLLRNYAVIIMFKELKIDSERVDRMKNFLGVVEWIEFFMKLNLVYVTGFCEPCGWLLFLQVIKARNLQIKRSITVIFSERKRLLNNTKFLWYIKHFIWVWKQFFSVFWFGILNLTQKIGTSSFSFISVSSWVFV